jgi:aspartoacylase
MSKILLIGATHGDELLGVKLYIHMLKHRQTLVEHVNFIIGNPKAFATKKRYTDCDLNRSYGVETTGYESLRARQIVKYIETIKPDIVLDMHTTTGVQQPCLIVPNLRGRYKRQYLRASHVPTLLQVAALNDIASTGDNIIGYEVSNSQINRGLLDDICDDIERFVEKKMPNRQKLLYTMTGKIYKRVVSQDDIASFVNFKMSPLGFVPIFIGEKSYKLQTDYIGFKATAPESIEV